MNAWCIKKDKIQNLIKQKNEWMPSEALSLVEVPIPDIDDDEALIKCYSAGLNFNTVWSTKCIPVNPFNLVNGHVKRNPLSKKHVQDYFIPGSDGAGVIIKSGKNLKIFKEGDEVVIHCSVIADDDLKLNDPMTSKTQSIWGYETNFGSFADYTIVKESQLGNQKT